MRRVILGALLGWSAVLAIWTGALLTGTRLALTSAAPFITTGTKEAEAALARIRTPPAVAPQRAPERVQALELQEQAQQISAFIKSEPPPSTVNEAVTLLASTSRQAQIAAKPRVLGLIVGDSQPADDGQFPYHAAIVLSNYVPFAKRGYRCGGALVSSAWVLTAGHCFDDASQPGEIQVYIGHNRLSESSQSGCNCWSKVTRIARHPNYALIDTSYGEIIDNDVALLKLASPVTSPGVAPVQLVQPDGEAGALKAGIGTIMGWGKTSDVQISDQLMYGTVRITGESACAKAYGDGIIRSDMLCATPTPADACAGDSGGALIMPTKSTDGSTTVGKVVGLVSWKYPREGCPATKPTVYSRVAAFSTWINQCVADQACPSSISTTPVSTK